MACQPSWQRCGIRISYLACLKVMATSKNLSLQYVNSMNWILKLGDGKKRVV